MLRHEYSHSEKRTKHAEEKLQIARRAVELIEESSTIFLGTGTTVEQMASMLPAFRLRIVTNSLSVFNLLEAREDCDLCLVGGMYRRRTAAFVGPTAEDALRALGIDAAFIGANGILDGDVSTSNMDEGRIQQLAFSKADSRYLIADSSKIGKRDFYTFCRLDSLDAVVCEPGITAEDRAAIEEHTQVIC
nr:DeoR/GlpR transcriptional regulator [Collinsella aerofaciens]